ncbi:MAG: S1 RNA-binding domain-containing protein [Acidimicrobiales bacterium]|jgi:hypothetical protein
MPIEHIVVDGSNIATEGRSLPSLAQLEQAVGELRRDHPNAEITVIVDATFAHRIDPSELPRFEEAALKGEYVHPPAGAIGRGDAFLLRVAEKVDATVLSNDSFQEFHGEHPWLFERGRLLGATPVPGIGWIFSPRQPVRGPRSHQAVRETELAKKRVTKAIAVATKEVVKPAGQMRGAVRPRRGSRKAATEEGAQVAKDVEATRGEAKPTPLAVNDPLAFISFIAEHRLGEQLEGEVEEYTSHGAVVRVGEMRCYIPLANLGDPAPRSAREVLKRKQQGEFVLTALDPQRRGAELALPGMARVSGHPREETVAAEVRLARPPRATGARAGALALSPAKKATAAAKAVARKAPAKRTAATKAVGSETPRVSKKAAPAKKVAARKRAAGDEAAGNKTPEPKPRKKAAPPEPTIPRVRQAASARRTAKPQAPAAKSADQLEPAKVQPQARRSPRTKASTR